MSAVFARLNAVYDAVLPRRRKVARQAAWATATLRLGDGESSEVSLADISTHGLRIKGDLTWLRAGQFVSIAIEPEPALQAIVRWVRDGEAGMEFLRPIPAERAEWHALIDSPFGG